MTFSIVARSADGTQWGVAVASKFLAVGSAVPAAAAGVGAIATQSFANLSYRPEGLRLLREGHDAQATLDALTAGDEQREQRQAGVVDADGRAATYTGAACHDWAGGSTGAGFAIQGNILTGPEVVEAMERAWLASDTHAPLARRLLAALAAGDEAGGDRRGRQSAAVLVASTDGGYGGFTDIAVDLRVDDHESPVPELRRLLDLHDLYFGPQDEAARLPLDGDVLVETRGLLVQLGHRPDGEDAAATHRALWDWAGIENLEERVADDGRIDPVVLEQLRAKAAVAEPGAVQPVEESG